MKVRLAAANEDAKRNHPAEMSLSSQAAVAELVQSLPR
jgi:hypothetical protein